MARLRFRIQPDRRGGRLLNVSRETGAGRIRAGRRQSDSYGHLLSFRPQPVAAAKHHRRNEDETQEAHRARVTVRTLTNCERAGQPLRSLPARRTKRPFVANLYSSGCSHSWTSFPPTTFQQPIASTQRECSPPISSSGSSTVTVLNSPQSQQRRLNVFLISFTRRSRDCVLRYDFHETQFRNRPAERQDSCRTCRPGYTPGVVGV